MSPILTRIVDSLDMLKDNEANLGYELKTRLSKLKKNFDEASKLKTEKKLQFVNNLKESILGYDDMEEDEKLKKTDGFARRVKQEVSVEMSQEERDHEDMKLRKAEVKSINDNYDALKRNKLTVRDKLGNKNSSSFGNSQGEETGKYEALLQAKHVDKDTKQRVTNIDKDLFSVRVFT